MREIFCRGKNRNDHKWIYGYYVKYCQDYEFIFQDDWIQETHKYKDNGNTTLKGAFEVVPETVGQFTGLNDKNGEKIFEGDIVKAWSGGLLAIGKVIQRIDGLWLIYPAYQKQNFWGLMPNDKGETTVEIIGNIHDNPELLEVK
jgi:uncharacterized phage protein (TIGR01671 family)